MSEKYIKTEKNEMNDFFSESKHVKYNDIVADILWKALHHSPYTENELAEILDWDKHRVMMILSGDDTIDIYDMVHVAGALGYEFRFGLVKIESDV